MKTVFSSFLNSPEEHVVALFGRVCFLSVRWALIILTEISKLYEFGNVKFTDYDFIHITGDTNNSDNSFRNACCSFPFPFSQLLW